MGQPRAERKVLVISGASEGVGAAVARQAAASGWLPVLLARSKDKLEALEAQLGPDRALAIPADVSDHHQVREAISAVIDRTGRIDAVYANAGMGGGRLFGDDSPDQMRALLDVNVLGVANLLDATLTHVIDAQGHIVICSSVSGRVPLPSVYAASKWAVTGLGHGLRSQLIGTGVRVTLVEPGFVETPNFYRQMPMGIAEVRAELGIPQGLSADDVARMVLFALSQPPHVDLNEIMLRPTGQRE
jgi:NADP-dependent 3-hydroxy acid dehydrogenase YdfG